ncbi:MAG: hypothetical protein C3F06_00045 [Candidatus Methanoperedenaceae archaeon]|nr:MAG: hypothetical protein C3F06_00045 [Candidatus Methanoperedenaceae archaeon]
MSNIDTFKKRCMNHLRTTILISLIFLIFFTISGIAASPQIKLTTNRYVILDDPNSGYSSVTAHADSGFGIPGSWSSDVWKGESTTIRSVALVLNENGTPVSGVQVTFSVLDWDDASPRTLKSDSNNKVNATNSNGLATASFNLNNEQQYGRWKISATATVNGTQVSEVSNFVYNWWGCQNCHGSPYSNGGNSESYPSKIIPGSTKYDPYSPYVTGRDFHATMYTSDHLPTGGKLSEGECWACHNSYDKDLNLGQDRADNGASYPGKGTPSTYGVHTNLACAECHSIIGNSQSGSQIVKSCDASGCHQGTTDFNSHLQQETVTATSPNKYVNYSAQDLNPGLRSYTGVNPTDATFISNPLTGARAHTSAAVQNIPCTLCHGPMHNITKPDINTASKNTITEDSQCTTCHSNLKHSNSNPVYCTACHSQDAHRIKVLGTDGTYKDKGSAGAITSAASDCVDCHNSGSADNLFGNLTVQDPAAYNTNYDPAGKYLTQHPTADCTNSCHDTSNFHNISSVGGGSNCLACHNSTGSALHRVDGNAIATGMHANLNPKTPADPNSKCWGCHQSDGNEPQNNMGDIYSTPYKCVDCHLSTGVKSGFDGAFVVDEHYPSGNDIRLLSGNNLSACIQCHNKSEMKVNYISPDDLFTNYSLVSHYGKNRNDLHNSNETNCAYCHQGSSEFNDIFLNINNTAIIHNNGQSCLLCHRESGTTAGRIHDSSLLGAGGPDCRSCHDIGTTNVIRHVDFNAAGQSIHNQMNINVDPVNGPCWGCHQTGGTSPSGMGDRAYNPYICTDCHLSSGVVSGIYNAPLVSEHYRNGSDISAAAETTDVLSCVKCHQKNEMVLTNNDTDPGTYDSDGNGILGGSTNPYIYGKKRTDMYTLNETYCSYCHKSSSEFDNIFVKLSNSQINHDNGKSCYLCHREKGQIDGRIHDSPLMGGGGGACLQCHSTDGGAPVVNASSLGSHINLNLTGGSGNLTNEDCSTCHYNNPHTGTNVSNTYYCYDCHNKSVGGRAPIRATKKFDDNKHGAVTCINCHVADGIYHQGNPRGSVANPAYVSRYPTTNTNTTDCADCHRAANLDDAPFYAPGGGSHIGESCSGGGCHGPTGTVVQVIHNVNPMDSLTRKPFISTPTLDHSTVTQGTDVNITATVNFTTNYGNALVDGAQYQIKNSDNTQIIQSWTPMIASDGNFNTLLEAAKGRINTSALSGTYNIEVRGMGGGPSQNPLERYYPMNGDISPVKSVILTVQPLEGFINGTITSGGSPLEGALVSTTGASDTTGPDGTYSLRVPPGTYVVTASNAPIHNDNTTSNIEVTALNTSYANMALGLKATGSISGTVTNV